jgi:hypothetical protein
MRLVSTPMVGELLSRVAPPSRKSVLRLARFVGEEATIAGHPDLIDLLVAVGRDSTADRAAKAELRALISPFALLSSSGVPTSCHSAARRAPPAGNAHTDHLGRVRAAR